jgi:hypothetical protein
MALFTSAIAANADDWSCIAAFSIFSAGSTADKIGNEGDPFAYQYGLRFENTVSPIPQGATISAATIDFHCSVTQTTNNCKIKIYGVAADAPAAPTTYAQHAAHALTTAFTSWTVPSWTGGNVYTSADFTSALQEIVNRGGWASGNALIIRLDNDASTSGHYRQFRTHDNSTPYPTINVTYSVGGGGGSGTSNLLLLGAG